MRNKIEGLTNAIRQVFKDNDTAISWQEICFEIRDLIQISPEQEEITYGQPNFFHSVRRILTELVRKSEITRVGRGMYLKCP